MERPRKPVEENYSESNASFPNKLFALMANEHGTCIQWASHGFAFKICDQNTFLRHIIPKYFRRKSIILNFLDIPMKFDPFFYLQIPSLQVFRGS